MSSSIKRRLLTYMITVTVITAVPAFVLSLLFSYQEAKDFQDITLQQVGDLQVVESRLHHDIHRDKQYQLSVLLLSDPELPQWIPSNLSLGFHTLDSDEQRMRVWVGQQGEQRFVVMQPTSERDVIVLDNALRSILPLLMLMPLLSGLIWLGVSKELASVTQLAKAIDQLVDPIPKSLPQQSVPSELQGFILAINHLLARLHQLFVRQQRFSADAAHELRTPLAALSLQVQNLAQASDMNQVQARLQPVTQGVERCQRLAAQLLELNRLQSQSYPKQPVKLEILLLDLLSLYWSAAEQKQQLLVLNMPNPRMTINSHAEALALIIGNGLDNAIKYAPENSEITLSVAQTATEVVIRICDEGNGIEETVLHSLFEPFFRAHEGRVIGNGLGLSIAQTAAQQLGVRVEVVNRLEGKGLCFALWHPC